MNSSVVRSGQLLLCLAQLLCLPRASAAEDTTQMITRLETELNEALMACDAKVLGRLWAPDMTFVFPNGSAETQNQRLEGLAQCTPGSQKSMIESLSITGFGETTVALVLSDWSATINGKPFAAKFRATHVWAKRVGKWALVAAHVSQIKQ